MSVIRTFCIDVSKDVRIRGYFLKPKGFRKKNVWETLSQNMPFTSSVTRIRTVWWRSNRRHQMIILLLLQWTKVWNLTSTYSYKFASLHVHISIYVYVSLVINHSFIKILGHGKIVTYSKYWKMDKIWKIRYKESKNCQVNICIGILFCHTSILYFLCSEKHIWKECN